MRTFRFLCMLWVVVGGCVHDDLSHCPQPAKKTLYIRVIDVTSGDDITSAGNVTHASVFVFDQDRKFVGQANLTQNQLEHDFEVILDHYTGNDLYVSVWGNVQDNVTLLPVTVGAYINSPLLNLTEASNGYKSCPGELFFGLRQISGLTTRAEGDPHETIDITQKNARLMVTVRGLPADAVASDYYFTFGNQNNGYDFQGTPTDAGSSKIIETGTFDTNHDYVSPAPYYLIHSVDPDKITEKEATVLHLFQKSTTRADIDLTGEITTDSSGKLIALASGKTTNVLIDLTPAGGLQVTVVLTDWDHIYQWTTW